MTQCQVGEELGTAGRGAHAGTAGAAVQGWELGSHVPREAGCAGSSLPTLAGAAESPAAPLDQMGAEGLPGSP